MEFNQGDVLSHAEMSLAEGMQLQRGMNFRPRGRRSILLMSTRPGSPYEDAVGDEGRTLIYEGHDANRTPAGPNPKTIDQPEFLPSGKPTQNGRFAEAARRYSAGTSDAELVNVYEKIKSGIWVFNGVFRLIDVWRETSNGREVFKFRLELADEIPHNEPERQRDLAHQRVIPSSVKLEVWKRDSGKCTKCGSRDNLHFDHILPYSKGGSSLVAENIQLLCARHNLQKSDRIE